MPLRPLGFQVLCLSCIAILSWNLPTRAQEVEIGLEPFLHETRNHGEVEAEIGRFKVPESGSRGPSRELELVFVRLRAQPGADGPPIVYLAGGPGGSGIRAGEGQRFRLFDALRASGDVILFDQRGTGRSSQIEPEECEAEALYPLDRPLALEPYLALVEEVASTCSRFWAEHSVDLDAYTTLDSVADLEALRRGLEVEQIDLLGISYGTHLAMAYLRRHPERVRRVVLAGSEGPDHTVKLPSQFVAQLEQLEHLETERSTSSPPFREIVHRVLAGIEHQPATVRLVAVEGPDSVQHLVIGRRDLEAITMRRLLDPESMVQLPALYDRLEQGDFTDVAGEVIDLRHIGGLEAMPEAMDAASGISRRRLQRLQREDATLLLGSGVLFANIATARGLGVRDLGEDFRSPLVVDTEVLFISGSLDGRTPPSNAEELLPGFSKAQHLIVRNGGHSDDLLIATPELEQRIVNFFLGRMRKVGEVTLPPPDPTTARRRMPLTPEQATRYVGEYERRDREIWRILHQSTIESLDEAGDVRFSNAVLQIRWGGDGFPFHPVNETTFYIDFPWFIDDDFRFEFDSAGEITHLVFEDSEGREVRMEKVH